MAETFIDMYCAQRSDEVILGVTREDFYAAIKERSANDVKQKAEHVITSVDYGCV